MLPFYKLAGSPSHSNMGLCHVSSAGPVLFNHVSCTVCCHVALRLPQRMAILPNMLHVRAHFPFLKFLHSGQLFFLFEMFVRLYFLIVSESHKSTQMNYKWIPLTGVLCVSKVLI